MDWTNVTPRELWDALREAELGKPRAAWEFLSGFTVPKNQTKWTSRLKCNVYYYITNYLLLLGLSLAGCLLRRPLALFGAALGMLALLCLNDPFAAGVNDVTVKLLRRVHPHAASALRSSLGSFGSTGSLGVPGAAPRRSAGGKVLFLKRPLFIAAAAVAAALCVYRGRGVFALLAALIIGIGLPLAHASLRSPNLKARLASAREEFRAVWRGYQAESHDYTL